MKNEAGHVASCNPWLKTGMILLLAWLCICYASTWHRADRSLPRGSIGGPSAAMMRQRCRPLSGPLVAALLLAGAILGLVLGWLKWDPAYRSLWLGPLSYKLHWAVIEANLFAGAHARLVALAAGQGRGSPRAMATRGLIAPLAATNLLYHFPSLFAVAGRLAEQGETSGAPIRGAAFRRLMLEGDTAAFAVHVALAAVATAGVMLLGLALRRRRTGDDAMPPRSRWAEVARPPRSSSCRSVCGR